MAHIGGMNNRTTSLYRPDEGRWLAGVAAGLSLRLGVPAWPIRIAFALLCFAGGLGVLLYLAGWILIPGEGETDAIIQGWLGTSQARRWAGVILVGIAVIILASGTRLIRGDLALAVVLIGIGVMLYRGDLSRGEPGPTTSRPNPPKASPEEAPEQSATPPNPVSDTPGAVAVAAAPAPPKERSYLGRTFVGVGAIALGLLGVLDSVIPGFHPAFHHYVALAVGVIGLGVMVGAWFGRPAGLVVLGILLIPILFLSRLVAAGGVDLVLTEFASVGQVQHRPGTVGDMRERYELGVGGLTIDLRDVDFAGQTVALETQVGIGEVRVRLPEGVAAEVSGEVGVGELRVGDLVNGGVGVEADLLLEGSMGTLVLESQVGIGSIQVRAWPVDSRSPSRIPEAETLMEEYRIMDEMQLRDDYTLAAGALRLDLGDLVLNEDRRVPITVDRGEVRVIVPDDVSLRIATRVDRGRITLFDEESEGTNLNATYSAQVSGAPRLTLDIRVGEGNVTVEKEER